MVTTMSRNDQNLAFIPTAPDQPTGLPTEDQASTTLAHWHLGPLPDPEDLARYESIAPGLASRLVKLARERATRQDQLRVLALRSAARRDLAELLLTFLLATLAGLGGFDSLAQGDLATGLTLSGGSLSAMALALLRRRPPPHP